MRLIIASVITLLILMAGDTVMIPLVMRPMFKAALGNAMLDHLRLWPAALFYLVHAAALVHLAVRPALGAGRASIGLANGAVLGLAAYSCYEMTSWTIMRDWNATLVLVDTAWGVALSGLAAWGGAAAGLHRRKS
jgi:uncharacterized membrane protein